MYIYLYIVEGIRKVMLYTVCEDFVKKMAKQRVVYLDVIRIIACFLVIVNHGNFAKSMAEASPYSLPKGEILGSVLMAVVCKVAVTLFVMVSGALLLRQEDSYRKHLSRIARILVILIAFSAGYYFWDNPTATLAGFIKTVFRTNVTTAYWYLYLYLGILVMLPILQKMVRRMKDIDYMYFFLLAFGFCSFDFLTSYFIKFSIPIFTTFIGIFLLGYWLNNVIEAETARGGVLASLLNGQGLYFPF